MCDLNSDTDGKLGIEWNLMRKDGLDVTKSKTSFFIQLFFHNVQIYFYRLVLESLHVVS